LAAGRRPSLSGQLVIKDTFTQSGDRTFRSILRDVALFTCILEGIGMLIMFLRFLPGKDVIQALYLSLFHSVSAFCNAGFSLFAESFVPYQGDLVLNLVLCFLIISGGIGFLVLSELKRQFPVNRRTWSRLSLHSKMVLAVSFTLLISGSLLILVTEWHNTLAPLCVPGRFLAGFFQAVTARTAGFNTLSIGDLANETLFLLILLMFIGASPGSCGGGIKTTTLGSLIVLGFSRFRGHDLPQIFYRTISQESVAKAISIVILSIVVVITGTIVLLATELGDIAHPQSRGKFLELLFEVVSAFGTVGLSTGVTPGLSTAGKLVITMIMFLGRLGPLVIAVAVSRGSSRRYQYAEEGIMVG
jgi:trk system potassium uptake protein TrkH